MYATCAHSATSSFTVYRGGGTGPADPASARPIILAQLVNIHTNAHTKPHLPLVYSMLDGQFSSLEFKY